MKLTWKNKKNTNEIHLFSCFLMEQFLNQILFIFIDQILLTFQLNNTPNYVAFPLRRGRYK